MQVTRTKRIEAFARQAGGWPDDAVLAFTLDPRNAAEWASEDAFAAALHDAGEVCAICRAAGKPELAAKFIADARTVKQVCVALTDARAELDEATHTDSTRPLGAEDRAIWAVRN
jgi:hypothetical protein